MNNSQPPYGAPPRVEGNDLMPLSAPLGVYQEYLAVQPEILVMREGWSWTGDKFHVSTATGLELVRMNAQTFSMSNRKEFLSAADNRILFTLRRRLFSIPTSFYLELPDGQEFLSIEGRWSFGTKFDVLFNNNLAGGQPVVLEVRGDWIDRRADIAWNGQIVAKIRRQFANWRELSGRHTYGVEVAPGTDMALITAIVVAIDESKRDN